MSHSSVPFGGLWSLRLKRSKPVHDELTPLKRRGKVIPHPLIHTVKKVGEKYAEYRKIVPCSIPGYVSNPPKGIPRYEAKRVLPSDHDTMGVRIMRCQKWAIDCGESKIRQRSLPYILPSGHLGGSTLLTWRSTSYQWFATHVRSIIKRLKERTMSKRKTQRRSKRQLTKIALYYALTNNDSHLERLMCTHSKGFTGLFHRYYYRVDDTARFCIDQALLSASWFELRCSSNKLRRAQSTSKENFRYFIEDSESSTSRDIRQRINDIADPWIINIGYQFNAKRTRPSRGIKGVSRTRKASDSVSKHKNTDPKEG